LYLMRLRLTLRVPLFPYTTLFRSGLIEGAVSAKTKRERPEILELMKAQFTVAENFPRHVFFAASSDPNGVFNWNITARLKEIRKDRKSTRLNSSHSQISYAVFCLK